MPIVLGTVIFVIIFVIVAAVIFAIYVANTTYNVTCRHPDGDKQRHADPHIEFGGEQYDNLTPKIHELVTKAEAEPFEPVEIKSSKDGVTLFGRLYKFSDSPIFNIFFHGYKGTALRDGCGSFETARDNGMNLLLVDQRANGKSGGNTIAFGILERFDCRDWVNFVVDKFGNDVKIVLSGVSLGAATVLTASGLEMPKNVRMIVADCGFTSPKEIICKVAHEQGYPEKLCYPLLRLAVKLRDGFDLDETSALEAVSKTDIPILIIHGDDDRYVPYEMGERLFEACASKKRFLRVPTAPHAASYIVDGEGYRKAVGEFVRENCG